MENELQIFKNNDLGNVRTITNEEGIWFVGKDVAEILGYVKTRNAIANHVDIEDKKDAPIQGIVGGTQQMTLINESGLYSLIFKSKLPQAKEFKRWVTSEVLPSIRKTGTYSLQDIPTELEQMATNTLLQIAYESNKLIENIDKLDRYYIPKHKTKLGFNKIIKNCLAYNDTKENCKLAKETLLLRLGNGEYKTYENIPIDLLENPNTIALIYDICKNINISIGGIA